METEPWSEDTLEANVEMVRQGLRAGVSTVLKMKEIMDKCGVLCARLPECENMSLLTHNCISSNPTRALTV